MLHLLYTFCTIGCVLVNMVLCRQLVPRKPIIYYLIYLSSLSRAVIDVVQEVHRIKGVDARNFKLGAKRGVLCYYCVVDITLSLKRMSN